MKPVRNTLTTAFAIILEGSVVFVHAQTGSAALVSLSQHVTESENSESAEERNTDEILFYFLKSCPQRCSMARLAQERGNCEELRELGYVMMQGEREVEKKYQDLAAKRHVYAPHKPSEEFAGSLDHLPQQKCAEFDRQFVAGAIALLEKDIQMLRRASECEDRWVRLLASDQLPVVEARLVRLKSISEKSATTN